MSDIVERLRNKFLFFLNGAQWVMSTELDPDCQEAAGEIKRLRAAAAWQCEACGSLTRDGECDCTKMETGTQRLIPLWDVMQEMSNEIGRLRGECDRWSDLRDKDIKAMRIEIERLRGENDVLSQNDTGKWYMAAKKLQAENERLRGELELLRAELQAEQLLVETRTAEIERLRADKDVRRSQERNTAYEKDIKQLEAEIERLRRELGECQAGWETGAKAIEENKRLRGEITRLEGEVRHWASKVRAG